MHKVFSSDPSTTEFFQAVGGKIIKATMVLKSAEGFCDTERFADIAKWSLRHGGFSKPKITLELTEATEADLVAIRGDQNKIKIDAMLKYMAEREQPPAPPPPLRVEISNISELQKDSMMRVVRDENGKLVGATSVRI